MFENHRKSLIQHFWATFTFWVDKSTEKMPQNGHFWWVLENLKLTVKQCYQTSNFWMTKIGGKCQNWIIRMSNFQTLCLLLSWNRKKKIEKLKVFLAWKFKWKCYEFLRKCQQIFLLVFKWLLHNNKGKSPSRSSRMVSFLLFSFCWHMKLCCNLQGQNPRSCNNSLKPYEWFNYSSL